MRTRALTLLATCAVLAAACGREAPQHQGTSSGKVTLPSAKPAYIKHIAVAAALERYTDCAAVTKSLRADVLPYVGPYGLNSPGGYGVMQMSGAAVAEDRMAAPSAAAGKSATAGVDYSATNVQEQGVDEPDLIDTDGRRIFAIANSTLHAAVVDNGKPRLVGALKLSSGDAQLMLTGDRLIVIGSEAVSSPPGIKPMSRDMAMSMPIAYSEKTLVQIIDVSNPAAMRIESTLHLDGSYVAARAVKGIARIVVRRSSPNIAFATPSGAVQDQSTITHAINVNKDIVRKAGVDKWIPRYTLKTKSGTKTGELSSCSTTYHPPIFSGPATVTVVTVDPANPRPHNGSTVVGGGEIVYASQDAMYVTAQKWPAPVPVDVVPQGKPGVAPSEAAGSSGAGEVAPAPDGVVSSSGPDQVAETQIHKFSITGPTASYVASGIVDGTLLNQFAMSEFAGNLRVASTTNTYTQASQSSSSGVTVFAQNAKTLVPVGHVGGLGKGEQIRAVRFIDAVGYVVTFQQIDPLYTIDLKDPVHPKVAGELKIPGFSAYLHPVGDGLLLGVGEVADAQGHVHDDVGHWFGTKVSLFDVHDPAHAKEISTHTIPGGQSAAENEHHAFLWWAPRKLAVVPVSAFDQGSFRGAVGMHVDKTISEVGRIANPDTTAQDYYEAGIQRAFVVGDLLFTLSTTGMRASDIGSFAERAWLPF